MRRRINASLPTTSLIIALGVIAWIGTNSPSHSAPGDGLCPSVLSPPVSTPQEPVG